MYLCHIHLNLNYRFLLSHNKYIFKSFFLYFLLSIHQCHMIEWIANSYYINLGGLQKQSLRKGVYNSLTKNFERVLAADDKGKRQKKGTIRWRKIEVLSI